MGLANSAQSCHEESQRPSGADHRLAMKNVLLGSLLAALAMFIFGAAFWMSGIPTDVSLKTANNDTDLRAALLEQLPTSGTYFFPAEMKESDEGPVVLINIRRQGANPQGVSILLTGLILQWATALLIALLLRTCVSSLPSYWDKVKFATVIGVIAAVSVDLGNMNWWFQQVPFTLVLAVYHIATAFIGGLVLAQFVKPEVHEVRNL